MIIDAFTYCGELELLKLRLEHLKDDVDLHILIEADSTFRGQPKPIYYDPNLVPEFAHKIRFLKAELKVSDPWQREYEQRNALTPQQLRSIASPWDTIFMSDVDEIPDHLKDASEMLALADRIEYTADCYYYAFNLRSTERTETTKGCLVMDYQGGQWLRRHKDDALMLKNFNYKAWHYTYCMTPEQISNKIKSFAHSELDRPDYTNLDRIVQRQSGLLDPFDRAQLSRVPIEDAPRYVQNNVDYYKALNLWV